MYNFLQYFNLFCLTLPGILNNKNEQTNLDAVTWQQFWNWMKIYREDLRYLKPHLRKFAVFQQKNLYQTTFFNFLFGDRGIEILDLYYTGTG